MSTARPVVVVAFGASQRATAAAGPVVSIKALTQRLDHRFDFRILANPQLGLGTGVETPRGFAELISYFKRTPHDLLVLSSFFDREYTLPILLLRRLGLVERRPTILSPRGEFSQGALALKRSRKATYIAAARTAGLLNDVWLHGTSEAELLDVKSVFPWAAGYVCAENIRSLLPLQPHRPCESYLRLAFLGRVAPVKNLNFALQALANVQSKVKFDIYGPLEDPVYWDTCCRTISALPQNVSIDYKGPISNDDLPAYFAECDLLYLPSVSENFGHAIFEALSCGVPVLIGDQTPWKNLSERGAGWSLPLDRPEPFTAAIDELAAMSEAQRERLRHGARALAAAYVSEGTAVTATAAMFDALLNNAGATSQHKAA